MYLTAVIDWYSRYVLSWELSNTLKSVFCVRALKSALGREKPEIFNTAQGSQFTSEEFTSILLGNAIKISMDNRGRALDNIFYNEERPHASLPGKITPREMYEL